MKTFFLLSFLADFASAALSAYSVTHETQKAGATGNVVIAFTVGALIEKDGVIKVTFPTGVDLATGTPAVVAQSATIDGSIAAAVAGQILTLTRSGGTDTSGTAVITITVSNIKNPSSASAGGTATIGCFAADGSTATADAAVADVPAIPFYAALTATSVLPKSFIADADSRFAIDFTTSTTIKIGSKIEVTFPTNFDLKTLTPAILGTPSGVDGTWAVTVTAQKLTLTQTGGSATAAGAKSFLVSNIGNPAAGASGTFTIQTFDGTTTKADLDDQVAVFNIKTSAQRLGSSTQTTIEGSILAVGEAGKTCLGKFGIQEDCAHTSGSEEVCNPYTKIKANFCFLKVDVLLGDTAHGKTGTSDADPAKASWCVPHTLDADFETTTGGLEANCKTTEVCNKASKDATKTCILKADLIGSITADWTHLGQLRKPAKKIDDTKGDQWCFAKTGTPVKYFAAQCVSAKGTDAKAPTNTNCNPNATILGDVCFLAYKTLEHGEEATEVKTIVIGDSYYKKDCAYAKGSETVANWGADSADTVCIAKKDLLNEAEPLNALRTDAGGAGTDASPLKFCMSKKKTDGTNGFQACAIDNTETAEVDETEVCNPHGAKGGADHTLICVLKTRVLGHGEVVTKDMLDKKINICVGVGASSTCLLNEACDWSAGTCIIATGADSKVLAPWTQAENDGTANTCFGKEKKEMCKGAGYWCNPKGTTADGTVTAATAEPTSICFFQDGLSALGSGSICVSQEIKMKFLDNSLTPDDELNAIKCDTPEEPFCKEEDGTCSDEESVQTEVSLPPGGPSHAATTSIWICVAIAATLW